VPGSTFQLALVADGAAGDRVVTVVEFPPGAAARDVAIPRGVTVTAPAAGAPLTGSTVFAWTTDPGLAAVLQLLPAGPGPVIRVVGTGRGVTLGRLADAGLTLPAATTYGWSVETLAAATVDEAATTGALAASLRLSGLRPPYPPSAWARSRQFLSTTP